MDQLAGKRIHELKPGQKAKLLGFDTKGDYVQRLMMLGLTPGALLEVLRTAPLGDPIEILVRGTRLCLRGNEASCMQLRPCPPEARPSAE